MTFTDDDLKRLKGDLQGFYTVNSIHPNIVKALIARLEAAENAARDCGDPVRYKAWRKAAGK